MNRSQITLSMGDLFFAITAFYAALVFRFEETTQGLSVPSSGQPAIFVLILLFSSFFVEIYNQRRDADPQDLAMRIGYGLALAFFMFTALFYLFPATMLAKHVLFPALLFFGALQFSWHLLCDRLETIPGLAKQVLVVGPGPVARSQMGKLIDADGQQYTIAGYYNLDEFEPLDIPRESIVPIGCRKGNFRQQKTEDRRQ